MVQERTPNKIRDLENLIKGRKCKACGLYINQLPAFDDQNRANIFWVGLSAVQFSNNEEKIPLSPYTRSGALIKEIEAPYTERISFYRTNVVKCLPLVNDRIRYPVSNEMEKCFPNLEDELDFLHPSKVFLLGKQVGEFVLRKFSRKLTSLSESFDYECYSHEGIDFIPIHHPSYILVYKRRYILNYINGIQSFFEVSQLNSHSTIFQTSSLSISE